MADGGKTQPKGAGFLVLALGLLIGFVIGFVLLLSRLPVDPALGNLRVGEIDIARDAAGDYEFYTVLADERVARRDALRESIAPPPETVRAELDVITSSDARVLPGRVQRLDSERYREIPASSTGGRSYYLQTGTFRSPGEAERARAAVLLTGLDAFIISREDARGATGHRVRIGPFVDRSRLTEAGRRLDQADIRYDIVRVTG